MLFLTARPFYFVIGRRDDTDDKLIDRANGKIVANSLLMSYTLYKSFDISSTGPVCDIAHTYEVVHAKSDLAVCADKCASLSRCIYFRATCDTYDSVCDSLYCLMYAKC